MSRLPNLDLDLLMQDERPLRQPFTLPVPSRSLGCNHINRPKEVDHSGQEFIMATKG